MPPPTDKLSQLSIRELAQFSQSTSHSAQSPQFQSQSQSQSQFQSQFQSKPNTQDTQITQYTEYTEEATSSQRRQTSPPGWPLRKPATLVTPPPQKRPQSPGSAESSYLSSTPFSSPFTTPYRGVGLSQTHPRQPISPSDQRRGSPQLPDVTDLTGLSSSPFSSPLQAPRQRPAARGPSSEKGSKQSPAAIESYWTSSPASSPLLLPRERDTAPQSSSPQRAATETTYYSFSPSLPSPSQSSQLEWATPPAATPSEKKENSPQSPAAVANKQEDEESYLTSSSPFRLLSSPSPSTPPPPPPPRPRGRLFRTRSGNLATAAELRRRREAEQQQQHDAEDELQQLLLDAVLNGFGGEGPDRDVVTFSVDDAGRWRILRPVTYEFEEYHNRRSN
ncbi:hypothetical protein GGR52DRAFT_78146 [Hypoxylon sp. FL1284]|nr:hypothetical protein GGR52DRAFT_78146 [Hypoxylon sp. FL1284]